MDRSPHILSAASNLLGIALLIITGLNITNIAGKTMADEVAWVACLLFAASCLLSYLAIRDPAARRAEDFADKAFLAGLASLLIAVLTLAFSPLR
ncbi:hypothetical protein ACG3SL_20725 [Sphingomonas sp. CJ20]